MNTIFFDGNLVADVETRVSKNEKKFYTFRVAAKNRRDGTNYYNVSAVGGTGEACAKFLRKGSKVVVKGELGIRVYEKDGVKNVSVEIDAENVVFCNPVSGKQEDLSAPAVEAPKKSGMADLSLADPDDDIPF